MSGSTRMYRGIIADIECSIELDTNNRKAETRAELKGFNLDIEEINNKFTILLGDLRTEIETARWEQTRRAVGMSCGWALRCNN